MAENATLTAPAEDLADPFKEQLFSPVAPAAPSEPLAPAPAPAVTLETPAVAPSAPAAPVPAVTDDRPRGPDGKFLPKDAPAGEPPAPTPAPPKENLLDRLSKGEIDEIPAKTNGTNPGMRPAEGTDEYNTWKEQKAALTQARKEAEELRARLKETETKIPTDYEDIRRRAEAAEAREAARDVRARPEFQRDYAHPIQSIGQSIENIIRDRGFSKHKIGEIIQIEDDVERDNQLAEYLSNGDKPLPSTTIARIGLQIERLRELRRDADEVIKNAPQIMESLKQADEEEKTKTAEQEKQLFEKGRNLVFQVFDQEFADLMKNEKSRSEVEKAASRDWATLKPAQRALALASPALLQEYQTVTDAKIADYEAKLETSAKEVASLRLQLGRLGGGGPTTDPTPAPAVAEDPNADPFRTKLLG